MSRIVMKFGGTSVADLDRIRHVAARVKREVDAGNEVAVVVSAMAGATNQLVALVPVPLAPARRPRIRCGGRDRGAGHHRPVGDRACRNSASRPVPGRAGRFRSAPTTRTARRAFSRSRAGRLVRRMAAGQVAVVAGIPGCRPGPSRHDARAWRFRHLGGRARGGAAGRSLRYLHGRGWGIHNRSAHRPACAQAGRIAYEEMLELASVGREGLADPQRRAGDERKSAGQGAIQLRGRADRRRNRHARGG